MGAVVAAAAVLVVLGLVSGVRARTPVTVPMLALAAGIVLGPGLGILPTDVGSGVVLELAELTLAVVLFVDATRIDVGLARRNGQVPARMLVLGLPLAIGLGTVTAMGVLGLGLGSAFVLACLLAPTDAALAQTVLGDERVPLRVRQALNVESGLNDGLVVPVLTVALVVVGAEGAAGGGELAVRALQLVGFGGLAGLAVGGGVGLAVRALDWRTLRAAERQIAVGAVAVLAWGAAGLVGGNGFVGAFVAGVAFGAIVPAAHELVEFAEDVGELLTVGTFLLFGAVFVTPALDVLSPAVVALVVLSLTVVRMLPIAVSLVGLGLDRATVGVLGWFGPRGLATVVFGLEVLELHEEGRLAAGEELFGIAALAVVASAVAHGVSAGPLVTRYSRHMEAAAADGEMPEDVAVPDLPMRGS